MLFRSSLAARCSGRSPAPWTPPRRPGRAPAAHPEEPGLLTWGHVPHEIRPQRIAHPHGRSRTAACGTAAPPKRGSRSSPPPFPAAPSGCTSSRQLPPPSTMRRRAPKRPAGPRSPPSTTSYPACTTTRSPLALRGGGAARGRWFRHFRPPGRVPVLAAGRPWPLPGTGRWKPAGPGR